MPTTWSDLQAVVFDYGSTLIQFNKPLILECDRQLTEILQLIYGHADAERIRTVRNRNRTAPYSGEFRENNIASMCRELVLALYDRQPTPEELARLLHVRYSSLVEQIEAEPYVADVLRSIRRHHKVALLSNYPDPAAIRDSLHRTGLYDCFDAIVVSGEVGHVKPHPLPFHTLLVRLGVEPGQAVYIGDNWLGDIQGAKRIGMRAIHSTQWDTPEHFEPQPDDFQPDATIRHLTELVEMFASNHH
ncbi:MAG: HAD family hydrolase [Propionibacteriaceae bacterium]|nr:HAD family hydrolase [Propionibacteriaceae bacterium]